MAKTYNNPYNNRGSYFPHYICVQDDEILGELYHDLGIMGYGVYYRLLELLRNSMVIGRREYKPTLIIKQIGCDEDLLDSVIFNYNLFEIYEEEDKIYLQSRELTEYANYVEERRKKRAKAARAAALARWGKTEGENYEQFEDDELDEKNITPKRTPLRRNELGQLERIDPENIESESESNKIDIKSENCTMPMPEVVEEAGISSPNEKDTKKSKEGSCCSKRKTLDSEIERMQRDVAWLASIREELSLGEEQLMNLFIKFRTECIRNGKKSHIDLEDAMRHFRSWSKKYLNKIKGTATESERRAQMDIESKLREEKWQKNKAVAVKPDDYIRRKGYDPAEVTMAQVMSHRWCENHPPTHPEWIVEYSNPLKQEPIEVPF